MNPKAIIMLLFLTVGCSTQHLVREYHLLNSTWRITYSIERYDRSFDYVFHNKGMLESFHPDDKTKGNDFWRINNDSVIITTNDSYAKYAGVFTHQDTIKGIGSNKRGENWNWVAWRIK